MVFVVEDIIVIFRKVKTILILISFKRYFSHPEKSILKEIQPRQRERRDSVVECLTRDQGAVRV